MIYQTMKSLIVLLIFVNFSIQFNLDTQAVHVYKNDNGLFGFTVAMIEEKGILVGSPNADTGVDGVVNGGSVFECGIPRLDELTSEVVTCTDTMDIFNDGPNKYYHTNQRLGPIGRPTSFSPDTGMVAAENKSMEFLGSSLAANDRFIVACAHRYEHRYWNSYEVLDLPRQLVGRCLLLDIERNRMTTLEPCDNNEDKGYETYGNCQAGTSVALHANVLVLGTPGRNTALGGAFQYDTDDIANVKEMEKIPDPLDEETIDKYMGYSSVVCNMDGVTDETEPDWSNGLELIFGGPRGAMYKGQISIYNSKDPDGEEESKFAKYRSYFDDEMVFDGEQMGSYFGHSLACTDINNDGYDDLIVGAPWYSDYESNAILPDTGRIYIMYGSMDLEEYDKLTSPLKITGDQAGAAFGFSLSNAGDMNEDGFSDVFVGAPYYDDGVGAVFLYLGSEDGLQPEYSQLIKPTSLNVLDNIKTFGWSISNGHDMDGNGYPDVAIGAYKSGHVTFIRSKSIIDVKPTLSFSGFRPVTELSEESNTTSVSVCFQYKPKPDRKALTIDQIPIKFSITLDKEFSRLSYSLNSTKVKVWTGVISVSTGNGNDVFCSAKKDIFYDHGTGNVQPMPVTIAAEIDDDTLTSLVLNQVLINNAVQELTISSNCHPETGSCVVDLEVALAPLPSFPGDDLYPGVVFGKVPSFTQTITISNIGTDQYNYVYNAAVKITLPANVPISYLQVGSGEGLSDDVTCEVLQGHIMCYLPDDGPINSLGSQTFGIEFDVSNITNPIDIAVRVEAVVEDPTVDEEESNNVATNIVQVKELADLLIAGGSVPVRVPFNNQYTIVNDAIGDDDIMITHEYSLSLDEESLTATIQNIYLDIYWPREVITDKYSSVAVFPLVNVTTREPDDVKVYCDFDSGYGLDDNESWFDELMDTPAKHDYHLPATTHCSDKNKGCVKIRCDINQINRGASFINKFKVSLTGWVHEARLYDSPGMNVSSYAEISQVQEGMVLPLRYSATARTELFPSKTKSRNLLWIIIAAVIGGIFFLALLVFILWKIGFFKRKQPPSIRADKVDEQIDMTMYGE